MILTVWWRCCFTQVKNTGIVMVGLYIMDWLNYQYDDVVLVLVPSWGCLLWYVSFPHHDVKFPNVSNIYSSYLTISVGIYPTDIGIYPLLLLPVAMIKILVYIPLTLLQYNRLTSEVLVNNNRLTCYKRYYYKIFI